MFNQLRDRFLELNRRGRLGVAAACLAILLVITSAVLVLTGWGATSTVDDYLHEAGLADQTELRVGVSGRAPLLGFANKENSNRLADYEGFDIEITRSLAAYLGFDELTVRLVQVEAHDRTYKLTNGDIDIVVATYSITPKREEEVDFAGPYLISKPKVLMRSEDLPALGKNPSLAFNDLGKLGARLCTTGTSTSDALLHANKIDGFYGASDSSVCVAGLQKHTYDAFILDDVILAGYQAKYPGMSIVNVTTDQIEKYGIAVANGREKLRQVIGNFLTDSYERQEDGAWKHAWNKTLGRVLPDTEQPPPDKYEKLRDYRDQIRAEGGPLPFSRSEAVPQRLAYRRRGRR